MRNTTRVEHDCVFHVIVKAVPCTVSGLAVVKLCIDSFHLRGTFGSVTLDKMRDSALYYSAG